MHRQIGRLEIGICRWKYPRWYWEIEYYEGRGIDFAIPYLFEFWILWDSRKSKK